MRRVTINVAGKEYPCYNTMGAMLRYKQLTGKEASEINGAPSEMATLLYCCVASACAREGIEFDKTLMGFADAIDQDELVSWATTLNSNDETETAASAEDSKKKRRGS